MRERVALCISLILIGVFAACGSPPAATQPSPTSAPKTAVTGRSLTITGPSLVASNQTAAFIATESFDDGSTQDVTAQAHWLAGAPGILSVTGPGQATGHSSGETSLQVSLSGLSATVNVLVLPSSAFRLIGTVSEGISPLTNASVTVTSGTGAGLSAQTDANGQYRLYGVAGAIQIRATKVGFNDGTVSATVTANGVEDITLTTVIPEPTIAGTYAMTLDAGPTCPLPTEEMERHYTATITQTGSTFKVVLSGATFLTQNGLGNSFLGQVVSGQISYQLSGGDGYYPPSYPDFVESIADGRLFVVLGGGVLVQSGANLSGTLSGVLFVDTPPLWSNPLTAQCGSNQHRILLTAQASAAQRIRR